MDALAAPDGAAPPASARRPRVPLPPLTCDSHLHVFGSPRRYPLWPGRGYTPHVCRLGDYRAFMRRMGIERAVLVQPSPYGTDHRALLDALGRGGPSFRGIAVPSAGSSDAALLRLHEAGVRGLRLNLVNPQVLGVEDALALCRRVADLGWHLQVQLDLGAAAAADLLRSLARRSRVPLVVDHLGLAPPGAPPAALLQLLERGRCWVKLSAPYRLPGDLAHAVGLARACLAANPQRAVWGSDWPHTEQAVAPQAADWVDALAGLLDDPRRRQQVFVANPARLYGY